jgi:membrane protein implicated in regulation of membrane protease activity
MDQPQPPAPQPSHIETPSQEKQSTQRNAIIGAAVVAIILLAGLFVSIWALTLPSTDTAKIRDIFIIFMALESLLFMLVLVILIVQIARLINLLQNEIKPILDSTNETVSTLRGTPAFLSDNLVEPVIKLNEYTAGLQQLLAVLGLLRKKPGKSPNKGEGV